MDGKTDGSTSSVTQKSGTPRRSKRRKPKFKYPLVWIEWDDAAVFDNWEYEENVEPEIGVVTTVGFLLKETEDHIVVASTYSDTLSNARIQIPKSMIKFRTTI